MHIASQQDKQCCTCEHWNGIRAPESDGYVYSIPDAEGVCRGIHSHHGESDHVMTLPAASCSAWAQWVELGAPQAFQQPDLGWQQASSSGTL